MSENEVVNGSHSDDGLSAAESPAALAARLGKKGVTRASAAQTAFDRLDDQLPPWLKAGSDNSTELDDSE